LQGKVHYGYAKRVTSNPNNLILDCSSFTQYVYKQALGVKMGWGANTQHNAFPHVAKTDLHKGDLVFFSVSNPSKIGHVGIYIGGGKFIHNVNPKSNVVISDLTTGYWQRHYIDGARPLK
jgi:murein DD-endopeptidase / murein LD-carboxypeptidase